MTTQMPLFPKNEDELAEIVRQGYHDDTPFRIVGGGTKIDFGRPINEATLLSTTKLHGITLSEPSEMIVSARAGTPFTMVEKLLAESGQRLTFEPPNWSSLFRSNGVPTIGALAAGNLSGPRRIYAGAMRDSLIGVKFVNGRGEVIKSGGRVVKNVTGLDLTKLMGGAWGTLGALTQVTFKVLPMAEKTASIVLHKLDDEQAIEALNVGLCSPYEISGAAHLPDGLGETFSQTILRLEGFEDQLKYRVRKTAELLKPFGVVEILDEDKSVSIWQDIKEIGCLANTQENAIWKICLAPDKAARFVATIKNHKTCKYFYDWGGALLWLAIDTTHHEDGGAAEIRALMGKYKGHATLIRASEKLRKNNVMQPLDAIQTRLSAALKTAFDPHNILNPGLLRPVSVVG